MHEKKDWLDVFTGVMPVIVVLAGFYELGKITSPAEAQTPTDLTVARPYDPQFGGCLHKRLGTCRPNLPQMPCASYETPILKCENTGTVEQPGPTPVWTPEPVITPSPIPLPYVTPKPDTEDYLFKFKVPEGYMMVMSCPVEECYVVGQDVWKLKGPWTVKLVKVGEGK